MAKEKSLTLNSIFNIIKTFFKLVFPIVTFAYASRIVGDVGIGRVNYTSSIVQYFTMIALLGMNYYGTREAAKLRDDKEKLNKFVQEMLMINGCTTLLAYALLIIIMFTVPQFKGYETLLLINSAAIILQGLGMEWLYQAVEEYGYITVRSIIFKLISFIAIFIFVRDADDVVPYCIIHLIAGSGSYILNFINARKYVRFQKYKHYDIKNHLKPLLWLFAMAISIELYTVLDSTMLGFLQGDAAVGKYTAAIKVNKMVNTLINAAGVVLIPRLSYYISQKQNERVEILVKKVFNYMFVLSVPAFAGLFMFSNEIIILFSGEEFASAGLTARILTPIVLVIPFSIVTNLQIFIPMRKEKLILQSTVVGAITNFTLNMFLIPRYAENGAAIATVFAETAVAAVCLYNLGKFYSRKEIFKNYIQYWIAAISIPIIVLLVKLIPVHFVIHMFVAIPLSVGSYFLILLLFKNSYVTDILDMVKGKALKFLKK